MSEPQAWRNVVLGDILTKEQLDRVTRILNGKSGNQSSVLKGLKKYLGSIRTDLQTKGVDSDYLAYYLLYAAGNLPELRPQDN